MIGLVAWSRDFQRDANGNIQVDNTGAPIRIAYPLYSSTPLWQFLQQQAKNLSPWFDLIQLPPVGLAQGGRGDGTEGYEAFEYRNLNGTHWGDKDDLRTAIAMLHSAGMLVYGDVPLHQMGGENGGPGVFKYEGRRGETTGSWFQNFGQPGETTPPFVAQDNIPDTSGNYPFGRARSYQNSIPQGVVEADALDILQCYRDWLDLDGVRWDDTKATHVQSVARVIAALRSQMDFYGEFDSGNPSELNWWVTSNPMNSMCATEDYSHYWNIQRACNGYDATQIDEHGSPYWEWNPGMCIGFSNNADVSTTWGPNGSISQQTAFNLLTSYAIGMSLPLKAFMVYADDYFPASAEFPKGQGFKPFIDNLAWISRTFAFGKFARRWVDKDVYCYTRDGDGGSHGWSGGLLVGANFNTYVNRTIDVQTTWAEGTHVHDYTGHGPDLWVGANGRLTLTIPSNAYSGGRGYVCYAPAGVNHPVATKSYTTTQLIQGRSDLDVKPATVLNTIIGEIFLNSGARVNLMLTPVNKTGWTDQTMLEVIAIDPNGTHVGAALVGFNQNEGFAAITAAKTGWYAFQISASSVPSGGIPFDLSLVYKGTA